MDRPSPGGRYPQGAAQPLHTAQHIWPRQRHRRRRNPRLETPGDAASALVRSQEKILLLTPEPPVISLQILMKMHEKGVYSTLHESIIDTSLLIANYGFIVMNTHQDDRM